MASEQASDMPSKIEPRSAADSPQSLHQIDASLRPVLETVSDAIIVIDARGLVQTFSPVSERLFVRRQ